jgi:hypothetical protein
VEDCCEGSQGPTWTVVLVMMMMMMMMMTTTTMMMMIIISCKFYNVNINQILLSKLTPFVDEIITVINENFNVSDQLLNRLIMVG